MNETQYNVTNNTINTASVGIPAPEKLNEFIDWWKVVLTTAAISGLLSYYLMVILVLCPVYGACAHIHCFCDGVKNICGWFGEHNSREEPLNPFIDSKELPISTLLKRKQSFCFHVIFWANLAVFISCTVVFFIILADEIGSNTPWMEGIDIAGLAAQFGSQFCAILSCFIFSKVAYAVSTICDDMGKKLARVNRRADDESWDMLLNELRNAHYIPDDNEIAQSRTPHLTTLKKIDQWYVKTVKSSLDPYGTWFAFHWVLYTLTAFLSISYFAEAIIEELYGFNHNKCFHAWEQHYVQTEPCL